MQLETEQLLAKLDTPDPRRETARARQAAVWRGETPELGDTPPAEAMALWHAAQDRTGLR